MVYIVFLPSFLQFEPDIGLSDNEKRYQGLLRKQRLELNYLLKERERLIQAQQKLSRMAVQKPSNGGMCLDKNISSQKKVKTNCLTLTKEGLSRQGIYKEKNREDIHPSKLRPVTDSNSYVLTDEIDNESEDKVLATGKIVLTFYFRVFPLSYTLNLVIDRRFSFVADI